MRRTLDVSEQVGDESLLGVTHSRSEVSDASSVGLLGPSQVGGGDEDVSHRQHTETSELLGRVKDSGGESRGHLGILRTETRLAMDDEDDGDEAYESDLDPGLDLVLGLDEEIEHLLRVNDSLSVVGHQTVDELELVAATRRGGEGGRTQ